MKTGYQNSRFAHQVFPLSLSALKSFQKRADFLSPNSGSINYILHGSSSIIYRMYCAWEASDLENFMCSTMLMRDVSLLNWLFICHSSSFCYCLCRWRGLHVFTQAKWQTWACILLTNITDQVKISCPMNSTSFLFELPLLVNCKKTCPEV